MSCNSRGTASPTCRLTSLTAPPPFLPRVPWTECKKGDQRRLCPGSLVPAMRPIRVIHPAFLAKAGHLIIRQRGKYQKGVQLGPLSEPDRLGRPRICTSLQINRLVGGSLKCPSISKLQRTLSSWQIQIVTAKPGTVTRSTGLFPGKGLC